MWAVLAPLREGLTFKGRVRIVYMIAAGPV